MENEKIFGIDQFIGEPGLWGKGIGSTMIKMILKYLSNEGASKVILEVKKSNIRAISSYKKCGFTEVKELTKELVLMERLLLSEE